MLTSEATSVQQQDHRGTRLLEVAGEVTVYDGKESEIAPARADDSLLATAVLRRAGGSESTIALVQVRAWAWWEARKGDQSPSEIRRSGLCRSGSMPDWADANAARLRWVY